MANPRKFSEKIALQKQKQAEGTAEFDKIMKAVKATKMDETQAQPKILEYCYGGNMGDDGAVNSSKWAGGSGGGNGSSGASGGGASPEAGSGGGGGGGGGSPTAYRESRGRSVGVGPMRRPSERKQDRSPYGSSTNTNTIGTGLTNNVQNIAYLSPPMDSSWRRSNSDSALHQSLNMAKAGEGNFGGVVGGGFIGIGGMPSVIDTMHANYQPHHIIGERSQSPNIGSSFSPQTHRRNRGNLMHQQHQEQQQHQHNQQQILQHQLQLHMQQSQQQQQQQQHLHQSGQMQQQRQQQPPPNYNAKFPNCANMLATNSLFKSLQDQAMTFANTGSLPDLTSVHFTQQQQQQTQELQQHPQQPTQQQQQHTLSPVLSPHNNGRDSDQSLSPFSPPGTGAGGGSLGGPPSPYQQQHHSPTSTSAAKTSTAAQAPSPHLSFTNLSVQSPTAATQQVAGSFGNLTTLGPASSTGNLTDYRQPLNPPSPGSSPGLLTSTSGNELHTSAPASPTRHPQTSLQQSIQNFDRYSTTITGAGGAGGVGGTGGAGGGNGGGAGSDVNTGNTSNTNAAASGNVGNHIESSYNNLNPSFHNHFEQFSLGDSNSSLDQSHFQSNNFGALEFDDFVSSGNIGGNDGQNLGYSQNLGRSKILNFNNLTSPTSENNNVEQSQQQNQGLLNNNGIVSNGLCNPSNNNSSGGGSGVACSVDSTNATSPLPPPLVSCLPSPSSPLPIPISAEQNSPHNHHHQQQQHVPNHHHQMSFSLHSQNSPHHSPMHSPHHTSNSPLSVSSPGGMTEMSCSGGMAPISSTTSMHVTSSGASQQRNHQQQQQQSQAANTPTANIPSIIFSDYSSNSDFSREIFENLDLDLGQIEFSGLDMISDPTIEDSFRRDLN